MHEWISTFYGCQSSIIHALWISMWISLDFYGYPYGYHWISMDIHPYGHPSISMVIHFDVLGFLWTSIWISLDFYGYSCIDLLWILDPGKRVTRQIHSVWRKEAHLRVNVCVCIWVFRDPSFLSPASWATGSCHSCHSCHSCRRPRSAILIGLARPLAHSLTCSFLLSSAQSSLSYRHARSASAPAYLRTASPPPLPRRQRHAAASGRTERVPQPPPSPPVQRDGYMDQTTVGTDLQGCHWQRLAS